jgi:hypothetical protein
MSWVMFKDSIRNTQQTQFLSFMESNNLMLYTDIISVLSMFIQITHCLLAENRYSECYVPDGTNGNT